MNKSAIDNKSCTSEPQTVDLTINGRLYGVPVQCSNQLLWAAKNVHADDLVEFWKQVGRIWGSHSTPTNRG